MLNLPVYFLGSSYYLHTRIGGKQVKRSLRTSYKREALRRALLLLHAMTNPKQPPPQKYTLDIERGILQTDGEDDHARAMEALAALSALRNGSPTSASGSGAPPGANAPALAHGHSHALTLPELLEKFFLLRKHLKQATAIAYRNCINELDTFLKHPAITQITASDITRYQEHLANAKKKNSTRTIDNKISIIRALFNFAKKQGYTKQDNPAANRALLTKKQRLAGGYAIFEREEIATFFSSSFFKDQQKKDPDYANAVLLGLFTGCRIGEITNLQTNQFKITPTGIRYITIRDSKTSAGIREIPLHPFAYKLVSDFIESKNEKIFKYIEKEGKGTGNAVGKKFARNLIDAKIDRPKLVFHSLRKFVNNEFMKNGVNIETRCQIIGHELDNVNVSTYTNKINIEELAAAAFPTFELIYSLVTPPPELPDLGNTII